jgi:outer membrane protein OmpA-like peptidoglycan-associated protein
MREVIAVVLCLILFLIALQTGLLRTGLDYEAAVKQAENLQAANDRLADEVKRLLNYSSAQGVSTTTTTLSDAGSGLAAHFAETKTAVRAILTPYLQADRVEWSDDPGSIRILLGDDFLFAPNASKLSAEARTVLSALSAALKGNSEIEMRVVGHTATPKHSPNTLAGHSELRNLSWTRANAVAEFLEARGGVDPVQIGVLGYGDYHPLVANDTETHRARNRRVELILQPADPLAAIQLHRLVRIESRPEPKTEAPPSEENTGGEESIGEEQLQQNDKDNFDAGYDKPAK